MLTLAQTKQTLVVFLSAARILVVSLLQGWGFVLLPNAGSGLCNMKMKVKRWQLTEEHDINLSGAGLLPSDLK
jgi:hypothetical protein